MLHSRAVMTTPRHNRRRRASDLLCIGLEHSSTPEATSAAGGDETDLGAGGAVAAHGRGVTDVLMVTTTMGMLNRVHGHTTNLVKAEATRVRVSKRGEKDRGVAQGLR